jgi:glyoxylase-like metal-dependent hydrolase (beta-lactamase superfamily II)
VPAEKAALESSVAILRQYAAEESGFRETLATVTFDRRLTLGGGRQRVELRWFGPANTRGDAVVVVPAQGIVATGDLLVSPGPFAFGSDVGGWIAVLDSVRALRPRVMLPGHGPVMHDDAYLRLERRMLTAVRDRTAAAIAAGATSLADVRKAVTLDDLRAEVAGDDKWQRTVFHSFFLGPAVGQAYEAARPKP